MNAACDNFAIRVDWSVNRAPKIRLKVETETVARVDVEVANGVVGVAEVVGGRGVRDEMVFEEDDTDSATAMSGKTSDDGSEGECFVVVGAVSSLSSSSSSSSDAELLEDEIDEEVEDTVGTVSSK